MDGMNRSTCLRRVGWEWMGGMGWEDFLSVQSFKTC
jgi:hypothetical protein